MTTEANARFASERLAMLAALVHGDVTLAYRLARAMLGAGVPFAAITTDVLAPVQGAVGDRWAAGDLGIASEHAASAAVEELFVRLGATAEPATGPTVVVATSELDAHSLGARAVASTLALAGSRVVYLGASVPREDLAECLDTHDPLALALSCSLTSSLAATGRSIDVAHALAIPVVGGGRGIGSHDRAARLGLDAYAESPDDAVAVLRGWDATRPATLNAVPGTVPEHAALATHAAGAVALALERVAAALTPDRCERFAAELARVLRVVESALLLEEPQIVVDHVRWMRATGGAHGDARATIDRALIALAATLDAPAHRAASTLRAAVEVA